MFYFSNLITNCMQIINSVQFKFSRYVTAAGALLSRTGSTYYNNIDLVCKIIN